MLFPVGKMCLALKVSRGGFYTWLKSIPSSRTLENQMLETEILQVFENSKKIYGSPRITQELHKKNIKVSRLDKTLETGSSPLLVVMSVEY